MKKGLFFFLFLSIAIHSVTYSQTIKPSVKEDYSELHRPQFHFSPPQNWMNDPNGMFYYQEEYHLFYQHYPKGTKWGPMHWGHAVSKDMIHWENLPIALYPDSLGYIFSGSAVVDETNSSGFGTPENPPIVAIFTYHQPEAEKAGRIDYQYQGIAYSTDKGRTWTKYKGNPVLPNPGIQDFRDPKVSWNEDSKRWLMSLAVKDHVEFYASTNLKSWVKLSEFGKEEGAHGGVWECPDFFKLKNQDGEEKYVLLVSINPGGPNKGSATQYFVGSFDGKTFRSDTPGKNNGWIDYGPDNYAGVTFSNIPKQDGRRILIGWMSNWLYAQDVPTEKWRSANTIPRVLTLKKIKERNYLVSMPVTEVESLVIKKTNAKALSGNKAIDISSIAEFPITYSSISGEVAAKDFILELSNTLNQKVKIGFDSKNNRFFIDRKESGKHDFSKEFPSVAYAPRMIRDDKIKFRLIIDASSVEVFFDDGLTVLTSIFFPDENFNHLKISNAEKSIRIDSLEIKQFSSIWFSN
jgi:fructan beta-fructosidase